MTDTQRAILKSIAEIGDGQVKVNKSTARALERQGYVEISGDAFGYQGGVTCQLTDRGVQRALMIWKDFHSVRNAYGLTSHIAPRVIEKLRARLQAAGLPS